MSTSKKTDLNDDMNSREHCALQLSCCCGDACNRDSIIYYIETLEEIIRHIVSDEPQMTINQKEILELVKNNGKA